MKTMGSMKVTTDASGRPWLIVGTADGYEAHKLQIVERHLFDRSWQAIQYVKAQTAPTTEQVACDHPADERLVHDFGPHGYLNTPTGVHVLCTGCGWDFGEVGTVTDLGDPTTPLPAGGR